MKYIDVHCHLNFPHYEGDLELAIQRAQEEGVGMIVVGTTLATSRLAVEIANKHKNIWAIIGMHPIRVHEEVFDKQAFLKLAQEDRVVGIGECGFDFFQPNVASFEEQKRVFLEQIDIAVSVKKPLMLHLRSAKGESSEKNAYAQALTILRERHKELSKAVPILGDAHFFAGSKEELLSFVELGFCISFTGVITFTKDYDELVKMVPEDRLLSETDAPFVSPAPHRKERNEPVFVQEIAKKMAELREVAPEAFLPKLVENAKRVFSLKE